MMTIRKQLAEWSDPNPVFSPFPGALITLHHKVTWRQKAVGIGSVTHLLDYIKGVHYLSGTQRRIPYGFNNGSTLRILSSIAFIWPARSLGQSQFP
jgi:hypothetical protein